MNGPKRINPNNYDDVSRVAEIVVAKAKLREKPQVGIVCGSGLSALATDVEHATVLSYSEIPGVPKPTVSGHKGNLIFGVLENKQVVCMQGRVHPYEGHPLALRRAALLQARTLQLRSTAKDG